MSLLGKLNCFLLGIKDLKAIFTNSCIVDVWGPSLAFLSFFQISGYDLEIKWIAKTMASAEEAGSRWVSIINLEKWLGFHLLVWFLGAYQNELYLRVIWFHTLKEAAAHEVPSLMAISTQLVILVMFCSHVTHGDCIVHWVGLTHILLGSFLNLS